MRLEEVRCNLCSHSTGYWFRQVSGLESVGLVELANLVVEPMPKLEFNLQPGPDLELLESVVVAFEILVRQKLLR